MITVQYELTNFRQFMKDLSSQLRAPLEDNMLIFPPHLGEGFIRLLSFPDNTEALVYDFKLKHDLLLERRKSEEPFYTFMCEDINPSSQMKIQIEEDALIMDEENRSAMYLTGFLYDISYLIKQQSRIRGLRVLLTTAWLDEYINTDSRDEILQKYLELKGTGAASKKLDAESKDLLHQLVDGDNFNAPLLFFHSRILKQIEKFFSWLQQRQVNLTPGAGVTRKDIEKAIVVENLLLGDLTSIPPTIPELAKAVMMSESKLKKLFKQVYGAPPYVYFQKHRMGKARQMILTGEYAIKDVGFSLGYTNLSNFTIAFKKEHGILPSELLN